MTASERATLAFRIAGVYYFALALLSGTRCIRILLSGPLPADAGGSVAWCRAIYPLLALLIAATLFIFAGRLSWLVRRAMGEAEDLPGETMAIASVILGFYCAAAAVFATVPAICWGSWYVAAGSPAGAIFAVTLVAGAPWLVNWAGARLRSLAGLPTTALVTLFAGLLSLSIRFMWEWFRWGARYLLHVRALHGAGVHEGSWAFLMGRLVRSGVGLIVAGACMFLAAGLASRAARKVPTWSEKRVLRAPPSGWVALSAAVLLSLFYLLCHAIPYVTDPQNVGWDLGDWLGRIAWGILVTGFLAWALAFIGGPLARWSAGRLYDPAPEEAPARDSGALVLEVGITLVVLWHLLLRMGYIWALRLGGDRVGEIMWQPWHHWLPSVLILFLLVFRGDLARICMPSDAPEDPQAALRRAPALYPWLVLLGAWTLLKWLPNVFVYGAELATGIRLLSRPTPSAALVQPALGIILVAFAGPLSRLLSFGPILLRELPHTADADEEAER